MTRIGPAKVAEENIDAVLHEHLDWQDPVHLEVAELFVSKVSGRFDPEDILTVINLWHSFASDTAPIIRKKSVFPAALEEVLSDQTGTMVTQAELAARYGVSVTSISNKSQQLFEYFMTDWVDKIEQEPMGDVDLQGARREMEAQMKAMQELMAEQDFETLEDAQAFMNQLLENGGLSLAEAGKAGAKRGPKASKSASLIQQAMAERQPARKAELARQAIEANADEAEAYSMLGDMAPNPRVAAYYYREGMLAAKRVLGEAHFEEAHGHFWMDIDTRPYMRAKMDYAQACASMFNQEEAIRQYEEMLELNPNDNQGVRDLLLLAYLEEHKYDEALQLINTYEYDSSAWFSYSRVLAEHGLGQSAARVKSLLRRALVANRHVPAYLLGKKRLPKQTPEYFGMGDDKEAVYYAQANYHLWELQPKLTKLLAGMK
ncbi:hypothetical protein [Paenibacillus sp. 1P07SE]|uniref:tetratricopeptide repeat protein n=1 Tax=Paenibacillus sp. 1P07SE TaxID=3132209 RepID=UPI0039A5E6EA